MNKTSIIIVNYKQVKLTVDLLLSIKNFCIFPNIEIIIVDNEAEYETEKIFKNVISDLVYIPLYYNSGFAAANNIGAKIASGEWLFFINNDTIITSGVVDVLHKTMTENNQIGIACPVIKYFNDPEKIQYAGFTKINSITGRNKVITNYNKRTIYNTEYAHGAAFFIKKSTFKLIEGFDESYFLYYEELDLSTKVKNLGYTICVNTNASIYHKVSSSTGVNSPLKTYYLTRNRIAFMRKNFSRKNYYAYLTYHFLIPFPYNILKNIITLNFKKLSKYVLASHDGIMKINGYKNLNN